MTEQLNTETAATVVKAGERIPLYGGGYAVFKRPKAKAVFTFQAASVEGDAAANIEAGNKMLAAIVKELRAIDPDTDAPMTLDPRDQASYGELDGGDYAVLSKAGGDFVRTLFDVGN